jgi:hypothetical protein
VVLVLGVLRDLCYNPLVPVEYLMALKRRGTADVGHEREDVLLWYLSALLDMLEIAEDDIDTQAYPSLAEAIEGIRGLLVLFTEHKNIANLQVVESSCQYWANRVKSLQLKIDYPNLEETNVHNLPLQFDNLRTYILYRARRFLWDWHQLSAAT